MKSQLEDARLSKIMENYSFIQRKEEALLVGCMHRSEMQYANAIPRPLRVRCVRRYSSAQSVRPSSGPTGHLPPRGQCRQLKKKAEKH